MANEALDGKITHGRFLVGTEPLALFPDDGPYAATGNAYAGGGIIFLVPRTVDESYVVYLGGPNVTPDNGIPIFPGVSFALHLSRIGQLHAVANVEGVDLRFLFI